LRGFPRQIMRTNLYAVIVLSCSAPTYAAEEQRQAPTEVRQTSSGRSDRDEPEAKFQMARSLLRGEGIPKDENKAYALMNEAAAEGHADAMSGVGYFHANGLVVPKDAKKAMEWFRKGAEKGSAKAQLNLGEVLLAGKDIDADTQDPEINEGLKWIKQAADRGLPEACYKYGSTLYQGDFKQAIDYKTAMRYLKPAAEQGIPGAQNMVGSMYELALDVPMDLVAAESWYRRAALQGYARAISAASLVRVWRKERQESRPWHGCF
jgi:uncharacterized protein